MSRIVLLLADTSPQNVDLVKKSLALALGFISPESLQPDEEGKVPPLKVTDDAGSRIEFLKVARTNPLRALRKGFQEYRIAMELCPDLIVTDISVPFDAILSYAGVPFYALNEQLDSNQLAAIRATLGKTEWTYPIFAGGVVPPLLQDAEEITVLGEGIHRTPEDSGVVVAMSVMQMFSEPEPDYYILEENLFRVPVYQDNATVLANHWFDVIDTNSLSLPFRLDIEPKEEIVVPDEADEAKVTCETRQIPYWNNAKGIEIRNTTRSNIGVRSSYVIWGPYPKIVDEDRRFASPVLSLVSAIKQVNPDCKIKYKYRSSNFELSPDEVIEHLILKDKAQVALEKVEEGEVGDIDPKPIAINFESYDLNLTFAASFLSQWLNRHRDAGLMDTYVAASEEMLEFLTAMGFPEYTEEVEVAERLMVSPVKLYPA